MRWRTLNSKRLSKSLVQPQNAAPGDANILEAQTSAWLVRANAYTQSAMAEAETGCARSSWPMRVRD